MCICHLLAPTLHHLFAMRQPVRSCLSRLRILAAIVAVAALAGCGGASDHDTSTESAQTSSGGRIGSHAMVLTGVTSTAFISHAPLFDQPHDVQLVAQGAITPLGSGSSPPSFTEQLFTFVPEVFSLDDLRT